MTAAHLMLSHMQVCERLSSSKPIRKPLQTRKHREATEKATTKSKVLGTGCSAVVVVLKKV